MNAVKYLCKYNISILNGAGGTGKSFSTQAVIKMLEDNGKKYELFSPTGKAAKVLSGFTGRKASTIHRGLGYNPRVGWTYNQDCKLCCDVVIVDECSMVDVGLFAHLIDAIDFNSTKLMLIGDNAQLPSVGCGNLFHDFMQSHAIPTTTLTNMIQKAVNKNYGDKRYMKVGDVQYYDDDIVVQKQNNYNAFICDEHGTINEEYGTAFVANGETARIVYVCATYAVLDFDGIIVKYSKYDMTMVGLAYAMTIHKSQGSSIKNVILCTTKSDVFMLNSNLLYTGISRTKNRCYHLGSIDAVNIAVKKKANLSRQTFMQELMKSMECAHG